MKLSPFIFPVRILASFGFVHLNTKGSHVHMKYKGVFATTPLHKEVASGTVKAIYRQASVVIEKEKLDKEFYIK